MKSNIHKNNYTSSNNFGTNKVIANQSVKQF